MCRINAIDYGGGFEIEEAKQLARSLEEHGAGALDISIYAHGELSAIHLPYIHGNLVPVTAAVKEAVTIPVIGNGALTPEIGHFALQRRTLDFVAIGRGLIADPDWPHKAEKGNFAGIRPCISCLHCLGSVISAPNSIECSVNAAVGREKDVRIDRSPAKKKVLVIGGGLAGMEAAYVCALKGHEVTLYERSSRLGGQMRLAATLPYKHIYNDFLDYLESEILPAWR